MPDAAANSSPEPFDAGMNLGRVCELGALECQGSLLARCNAQRTSFELVRVCRDTESCETVVTRCASGNCEDAELECSLSQLLPDAAGVLAVGLGRQFTCAVLTGGALRCWGRNHHGQLGYGIPGNIGDATLPVSAGDIDAGGSVVQVVGGIGHTCALFTSGEVGCWGHAGSGGRLGDGDYQRRRHFAELAGLSPDVGDDETPASVPRVQLGGSVRQLAAGENFTCALLANGAVRCWGAGHNGALGQGSTENIGDDETPAAVPPIDLGGPAAFIAAGYRHVCAIVGSGDVRCWGFGRGRVLGHDSADDIGDDEIPASTRSVALAERAVYLSASETHSCAVLLSGSIQCWGDDFMRQLSGAATPASDGLESVVSPALDLGARALQIAAGNGYTCVLLDGGSVRCWGNNTSGQLGAASDDYRSFRDAERTVELGAAALQIEAHRDHTCAVLASHDLLCWGEGYDGNLGYGNTDDIGDDETPVSAGVVPVWRFPPPQPEAGADPEQPAPEPSVSDAGSPVINPAADAADAGEAGPLPDSNPAARIIESVALGDEHTCIVTVAGTVRCWGHNEFGQLGYGHTRDLGLDQTPAAAGDVNVGGRVLQLTAGASHTCALLEDGRVRCWGRGDDGQLGLANEAHVGDDEHPASVPSIELGAPALQIASGGGGFTCALLNNGDVRCWGSGTTAQLGVGAVISSANRNIGDDETPASIPPVDLAGGSLSIAVAQNHACALSNSGDVRCWGRGVAGRLGYGHVRPIGDDETPASAGTVALGGSAVALALGTAHSCALLSDGLLRCWGHNVERQLGQPAEAPFGFSLGDNETPDTAPALDFGEPVISFTAGEAHTCVLLATGAVRCFGANRFGQLGGATTNPRVGPESAPPRLDLGGEVIQIAAGATHTCALLATRDLSCWGDASNGKLGYGQGLGNGRIGDDETPASMGPVPVF